MTALVLVMTAADVALAAIAGVPVPSISATRLSEPVAVASSGYSGSIQSSAFTSAPGNSTVFIETPEAKHLRSKYGSRLYCEVVRGKTLWRWTMAGCLLGAVGGFFADREYNQRNHLEGEEARSTMLVLGTLLGAGGGWLFGEWRAPDCTPLAWTDAEREYAALVEIAREKYQNRLRTYNRCTQRNADRSFNWSLVLGVAGGVLGGVIGSSQGDEIERVEGGVIGGLIGLGTGVISGLVVGAIYSDPCGEYPVMDFVPLSPSLPDPPPVFE